MFKDTEAYRVARKISRIEPNRLFRLILNKKQVKDLIIDLNTNVQLRQQHVDSLGDQLFNQWTDRTFYGAGDELGRAGQPYEVYNSGDYFNTFVVEVEQGYIMIKSDPMKGSDSLFDMYTENIEGLNESSLIKLRELAKELYVDFIRKTYIPK